MRAAFAVLVGLSFAGCGADAVPGFSSGTSGVVLDEPNVVYEMPIDPSTRGPLAPLPPISGGTLIALKNGSHVVAADPDTDMVWKMSLNLPNEIHGAALRIGDEPGRLVEDGAQRVHVALRRGNAVVTIDVSGDPRVVVRRAACVEPRGIAYDAAGDQVVVACADGQLVSFAAAGGEALWRQQLELDDLRDVAVVTGGFLVSRFHSAELLAVDVNGTVVNRTVQPEFTATAFTFDGGGPPGMPRTFSAGVAWRMTLGTNGMLMTFQRGQTSTIALGTAAMGPDAGFGGGSAYGGGGGCLPGGVVQSELLMPGRAEPFPLVGSLPVDVAASSDKVAVAMAGEQMVIEVPITSLPPPPNGDPGCFDVMIQRPQFVGAQPVAVVISGGTTLVQTRGPNGIRMNFETISFPIQPAADPGHAMFHARTPSGLACASCHPEGRDDGRVWNFDRDGSRRTQTVSGGLLATAPFHWDGTLPNIDALMREVLLNRMGHPQVLLSDALALSSWLDSIPRAAARGTGESGAAARGRELFESAAVGCTACHTGARFTNNTSVDVGTGERFQVPSLVGVSARAPFMHNGCAKTLEERFTVPACGGGDRHGMTSTLTPSQLADLVAYLKVL